MSHDPKMKRNFMLQCEHSIHDHVEEFRKFLIWAAKEQAVKEHPTIKDVPVYSRHVQKAAESAIRELKAHLMDTIKEHGQGLQPAEDVCKVEPVKFVECCGNCRFGNSIDNENSALHRVQCRRYPPYFDPDETIVEDTQWCGEYQPLTK